MDDYRSSRTLPDDESFCGDAAECAAERQSTMERLDTLARLLDSQYRIPGVPIRFGLDALIGLLPGVGDIASAALSVYLINEARRLGAPRSVLRRMIGNVAIDTAIGAVPLLGDVFDVVWRANTRNIRILRQHLEDAGYPA